MRQVKLSAITEVTPQLIATATLHVDTSGAGFTEITGDAANFIAQIGASEGALLVYPGVAHPRPRSPSRRMPIRMCRPTW